MSDAVDYPEVTSYKQLLIGRHYWCKTKADFPTEWHVERCIRGSNEPGMEAKLGSFWASEKNHEYLFQRYEIKGPIPTPAEPTSNVSE
jgi:hypothetical protein